MRIRGLRKSIAFDYSLLLATGMLLLNFLIINLWQQFATRQLMEYADSALETLVGIAATNCINISQAVEPYSGSLKETFGEVRIFEDGKFIPEQGETISRIEQTVRLAGYSRTAVTQRGESKWTYLGLRTRYVIMARPVSQCNTRSAVGLVVDLEGAQKSIIDKQRYVVVYILVNVILLATIGFFRMRKLIITPLENLASLAGSYQEESGDIWSLHSKSSEFRHIAQALNSMISRIEEDKRRLNRTILSLEEANQKILADQKSLVEAEKFAAIGRLSAGLAHEIGNPLGIIQGYLELLSTEQCNPQDRKQYTERAQKELDRVTGLIHQLLHLARRKNDADAQSAVQPVLTEIVNALQHQKITANIDFAIQCNDGGEKVLCAEADIYQILLNCLLNSIDAIREREAGRGEISIVCRGVEAEGRRCVEIRIEDNGSGVNAADVDLVFDPFFTTKDVGHGTGLGLSVSRNIVENCGGKIRLQSETDSGTCVTIQLPCA